MTTTEHIITISLTFRLYNVIILDFRGVEKFSSSLIKMMKFFLVT